jgi:hypothetical protein
MRFANGFEVSVQFGYGVLCANQFALAVPAEVEHTYNPLRFLRYVPREKILAGCTSPDAEMAALWPDQVGEWGASPGWVAPLFFVSGYSEEGAGEGGLAVE